MSDTPLTYMQAVKDVTNHDDCICYDILLGLHCKNVRKRMAWYGRVNLGWKIMTGRWTQGLVNFPSGGDLNTALTTVARALDAKEHES